jgi:MFS family permease
VAPVPRPLHAAALGSGFSYANLAVALPLYAIASGRSAGFAAQLLAAQTLAIAGGALVAGPVLRRIGAWRALGLGLAVMGLGQGSLLAVSAAAALLPGAVVHGLGMGVFWVATQALLSRRSGLGGSARAFANQYALYVVGTAVGAASTGVAASVLEAAGVAHTSSIRATFLLALTAALVSALACRGQRSSNPVASERATAVSPASGLAVQVPDLFLVAGLGLVLPLTPIVLKSVFGFTPLEIGVVVGSVAAAKIAGSLTAGRLAGSAGVRRTSFAMLALSAPLALTLAALHTAGFFVVVLLATALLTTGVWPVLVDAAHARIAPDERHGLAVAWNVREYLVIAAATAAGGWTFSAFGGPAVPLIAAAVLIGASAAASAAVLRRPVYSPA